jgi:GNAT superfamily N-acetyltransferase
MSAIEIRPLAPALADDYLALFDRAFPDNPWWSGCYCLFHHAAEEPWSAGPDAAAAHRAARAEQLACGDAPGYLAYLDGRPVGWLNAGPRQAYSNLRGLPDGELGDALILCFVVAPDARRKGVASALLDFALQDLAHRGLTAVLAYPPHARRDELTWEASSYKGTLSMYLSRGFELAERGGREVARRRL